VLDILLFGKPAKPPYERWKTTLVQIMSWGRFDPANHSSEEEIAKGPGRRGTR